MNEMDHDEMVVTAEDFWSARWADRAKWYRALQPMMCAYQGIGICNGGRQSPAIEVGDRCFDTGDRIPPSTFVVLCETCAVSEIPDAAFDLQ